MKWSNLIPRWLREKFCGHENPDTIEEYHRKKARRGVIRAGNISIPAPHYLTKIDGKFRCTKCGKVWCGRLEMRSWD